MIGKSYSIGKSYIIGQTLQSSPRRWYQGFDWIGLSSKRVTPPIVPRIKNPTDASNFDSYPKDMDEAPEESSGWDCDF